MVADNWLATYRTTDGKQLSYCSRHEQTRSWPYKVSVLPDDSGIVSVTKYSEVFERGSDSIFFVNWMGEVTQTIHSKHRLSGDVLVSPSNKWVIAAGNDGRRSFIWNRVSGQFIGAFEPRFFPGSFWPSYSDHRRERFIRETANELRIVSWPADSEAQRVSSAWISTLAIDASGEILKMDAQPLELGPMQPAESVGDLLLTPDWSIMAIRINGIFRRFDRSAFPGLGNNQALVSADGHQLISHNGWAVTILSTHAACLREEVHEALEAVRILEDAFGAKSLQAKMVREVVLQQTALLMQKACRVQDDTAPDLWVTTTRTVTSPTIGEPTYKPDDGCILL